MAGIENENTVKILNIIKHFREGNGKSAKEMRSLKNLLQ